MIRYVLAIVLAVALVALSAPAIEHAASVTTERQVERDVDAIERGATSLIEREELPPDGQPPPRRTVPVTLPDASITASSIDRFEIERTSAETSTATVTLSDGVQFTEPIDAPIVYETSTANRSVELGGTGVERTLALHLATDPDGTRIVVVHRT
ncbi:DUF7311 family protein [Natrarchaeobius oligotrophus]|uniref:DUF7311 domain-containing protein n=1 Tax=Natrarchaeobius chitinivorans TaxID=1679083 RepID=A0A3N6MBR9_NATCH|nr:hypothetical protein [Natrarchaeobius chitinivorans]RQH01294.1 hypothetical protein EA472_07525 [Natrarchaeobius chitinivorans]